MRFFEEINYLKKEVEFNRKLIKKLVKMKKPRYAVIKVMKSGGRDVVDKNASMNQQSNLSTANKEEKGSVDIFESYFNLNRRNGMNYDLDSIMDENNDIDCCRTTSTKDKKIETEQNNVSKKKISREKSDQKKYPVDVTYLAVDDTEQRVNDLNRSTNHISSSIKNDRTTFLDVPFKGNRQTNDDADDSDSLHNDIIHINNDISLNDIEAADLTNNNTTLSSIYQKIKRAKLFRKRTHSHGNEADDADDTDADCTVLENEFSSSRHKLQKKNSNNNVQLLKYTKKKEKDVSISSSRRESLDSWEPYYGTGRRYSNCYKRYSKEVTSSTFQKVVDKTASSSDNRTSNIRRSDIWMGDIRTGDIRTSDNRTFFNKEILLNSKESVVDGCCNLRLQNPLFRHSSFQHQHKCKIDSRRTSLPMGYHNGKQSISLLCVYHGSTTLVGTGPITRLVS